MYKEGISKMKVGTQAFTQAVIERLGQLPVQFKPVHLNHNAKPIVIKSPKVPKTEKLLVGVDLFLDLENKTAEELAAVLNSISNSHLRLDRISNRGVVVYPNGHASTFCTNHWRCRFKQMDAALTYNNVLELQSQVMAMNLDIIKTENLYQIDGKIAYSVSQGEK